MNIDKDPLAALRAHLGNAGARVTLDRAASNARPCEDCFGVANGLVEIGTYPNGDAIRRPKCAASALAFFESGKAKPPRRAELADVATLGAAIGGLVVGAMKAADQSKGVPPKSAPKRPKSKPSKR